jgi:GAF domain-containing protein
MENHELWLADAVVELAEAADRDDVTSKCARCLSARLAELLEPAEVGVLIAHESGRLQPAAASTDRAAELVSHQARYHEGPCVDSFETGRVVLNETIATPGQHWPWFAAAARRVGLSTVSALPMRLGEEPVGAVCALAGDKHLIGTRELGLAQVLASTAAMAITQQREIRRTALAAEQLSRALDSRVLIEQAKGVLAARLGMTPEAAFVLLRSYARTSARALADIAAEVVKDELHAHVIVAAYEEGRGRAQRRQRSRQAR